MALRVSTLGGMAVGDDVVQRRRQRKTLVTPVDARCLRQDDGLAEDGRKVVVVDEDAAFEGEGAEGAAFDVVELGGGAVALGVR